MTFGYIRCLFPSQTWHSGFWGRAHVGRRSELNTGNLASILQWAEAELGVPEMRTVKMSKMSDVHSFKTILNKYTVYICSCSLCSFMIALVVIFFEIWHVLDAMQRYIRYILFPNMDLILQRFHTLKVWGSREVDQNSVPTGWSKQVDLPTQKVLQDNGRSHALEGWTERTWKHSKDLLVAQDGFRTVSNWELHVYASWVLT